MLDAAFAFAFAFLAMALKRGHRWAQQGKLEINRPMQTLVAYVCEG